MLVTGASGFIGRALCRTLAGHGYPLHTLWRRPPVESIFGVYTGRITIADLEDEQALCRTCDGVDTVFHLAGQAHVNHADRDALFAANVEGTRHLLEAAVDAGVRRLVYFSSILADPEQDDPPTAYGESKRAAEALLLEAHEQGRIQVCCLRPAPVYGPGMRGNLMSLIRLARRRLLPPLPRSEAQLSLVGVEDLCRAALLAAIMPRAAGAVLPVTDGRRYGWQGIEADIRRALGRRPRRFPAPRALWFLAALGGELAGHAGLRAAPGLRHYQALTRNRIVDDAQTRRLLGYNPRCALSDALPDLLAWERTRHSSSGTGKRKGKQA